MHQREALEYLKESSIIAVILDLNFPDIHGLELLKIIRNHPVHHSCYSSKGWEHSEDTVIGKNAMKYFQILLATQRIVQ